MSISAITGIVGGLIGLASEYIPDKDKQAEFELEAKRIQHELLTTILKTSTIPWVDATVKVIVALHALIRPIGAALMTAFGMYAHWKGIDMQTTMHAIFDGAFPAWGASRHQDKKEQERTKREVEKEQARQYSTNNRGLRR